MVNGNVLERRKRAGLGNWGAKGWCFPYPHPDPCSGGSHGDMGTIIPWRAPAPWSALVLWPWFGGHWGQHWCRAAPNLG